MKYFSVLAVCAMSLTASNMLGQSLPTYPITKKMSNPLFVDFPSNMYQSDSIGRMYTADGSAHVWADGRLYIYASHDMEPPQGCDRMDCYHVFSTDDMVNWTDHGEILSSADVKEQSGWGIDGWMWAPDCAYNPSNGLYYFYFPHVNEALPWGGHDWRVGIAVSDKPASDFHMAGYVEGAPSLIDPCVFVDDDGQPYIYNGGGGQCAGGKLRRDDWTRLDGEMTPMQGLTDFHEGTWVHKHNGKYYLSHSDNHGSDGNQLRYAMSDSPLGPWQDMGPYVYATGSGTIHGSIVEYKGEWYAVYHVNNPSGRDELRSVCVDKLEYNPDGSIKPLHNWGTPAENGLMLPAAGQTLVVDAIKFNNGGSHYAFHKNGGPEPEVVDSKYVANVGKGDWMRYSCEAAADGKYDVKFRVAPKTDGAKFHLSTDGTNRTGSVELKGAPGEWTEVSALGVEIPAGIHYLDFRAENGTFDIENIIFTPCK